MIDLHMHSRQSDDGEFTPSELAEKCRESGVETMSLTDHNTVSGTEEALAACRSAGLNFIPGIEIDCSYSGVDFHVLGYGIDWHRPEFRRIEADIAAGYAESSMVMLEKVRALGFDVSTERLDEITADCYWKNRYYPEAFAEALLSDPRYTDNELLRPFRPGQPKGDNPYFRIFLEWFSQGKACYAPMDYPPVEEIIGIIHSAGGLAVLAHPGNNLKGHRELLPELCAMELDGLEVFSSYHDTEATEYFYGEVKKRGLYMSCGSDFHGKVKPRIPLGSVKCTREAEDFAAFLCGRSAVVCSGY